MQTKQNDSDILAPKLIGHSVAIKNLGSGHCLFSDDIAPSFSSIHFSTWFTQILFFPCFSRKVSTFFNKKGNWYFYLLYTFLFGEALLMSNRFNYGKNKRPKGARNGDLGL